MSVISVGIGEVRARVGEVDRGRIGDRVLSTPLIGRSRADLGLAVR